ncbi:MAG: IS66 family transposase, partial [Tannerellaceae bacterium]
RYISLSRRNSLFFGSHEGAKRGALFYSLACSCRMHNINFFEYLSDVINKAATLPPTTSISVYRELLPDKWKKENAIES